MLTGDRLHESEEPLDVSDQELAQVQLCGGFGNYVNLESARRIRLLPIPIELVFGISRCYLRLGD